MERLHAVIVGINVYKSEKLNNYPLKGCLNDVARMSDVLHHLFPSQAQIQLLTENQATRESIIQSFRTHLIEPARLWAGCGRPEPAPAFLFHFSGHGSLARDVTGTKPSGFDETIVPYDSRQADIFDLRDWELGALIDELGEFTNNITIVLDCCHSGSGTRRSGRMCEPDLRIPLSAMSALSRRTERRGLRSGSTERLAEYVLLAACDAKQIAEEYHDNSSGTTRVFGAMTYALTEVLRSLTLESLTYRDVHEITSDKVQSWYPSQSPQCEGDRDRLLFQSTRAEREESYRVVISTEEECTVDAGLVHGFTDGEIFDVYPSETRSRRTGEQPIATLRISNAGVIRSRCQVLAGKGPVPVRSRVFPATERRQSSSDRSAHQRFVLGICNSKPSSLHERMRSEIHILKVGTSQGPAGAESYETVAQDADGLRQIAAGAFVYFSLQNLSDVPLYCQILSLGYDGSVTRIWPRLSGEQVAVEPGRTIRTSRFRLCFHPDDRTTLRAREFVKIFAATLPFDVDALCTGNRSINSTPEFTEDWTTLEVAYEFSRAAEL